MVERVCNTMGRVLAGAFLAAVVVAAVATQTSARSDGRSAARGRALKCTTIEKQDQGFWKRGVLLVARNANEWQQALSAKADEVVIGGAVLSVADVDWSKNAVVLVAMGQRSPYRDVEVSSAHLTGNQLVLEITVRPAGSLSSMYAPYHLVLVETGPRSLAKMDVDVDLTCDGCSSPMASAGTAALSSTGDDTPAPERHNETWGSVKALYR